MKTIKPLTTISYNTKDFLINKLNSFNLKFWCFIIHKADEDDKKQHIHLYVESYDKIDVQFFSKQFDEYVDLSEKPLKVLPFSVCNSRDDFLLYALHDNAYLIHKSLTRNYSYKLKEFYASDYDLLNQYYNIIDYSKFNKLSNFISLVKLKWSFIDIVESGVVPIQQIFQYQKFYTDLQTKYFTKDGQTLRIDL